jgi:hypothetical protein
MAKDTKMTKIEKFIIEIAGTKIELTPEQAKELRDILVDALGQRKTDLDEFKKMIEEMAKKKEKEYIPVPAPYPVPSPPWPIYPISPRKYWEPVWVKPVPSWTSGDYKMGTLQITCRG